MTEEIERFPLTGRFLMGRLRHAMSLREKELLESLVSDVESFSAPHVLVRRGEVMDRSTMLVEGYVLRTIEQGGRRSIVGIHVPGDYVDLHAFALKRLDTNLITIGPAKVAHIPHEALRGILRTEPHLTHILWFATLLDGAIGREWIMRMERLQADGRVAHLFTEIWQRLEMVGLGRPDGFHIPLTQADLADMCGTTAIHMNRTLRALREGDVLEMRRGRVIVPDRERLKAFTSFDLSYLYGQGELQILRELDGD